MSSFENIPDESGHELDAAFDAIMAQTNWTKEFGHTYEKHAIALCKYVDTHSHWLRTGDGLVYMTTHHDDADYQVLLTNRTGVVAKNRTAIIINKMRSPESYEPNFPDGRVLSMTDIMISRDKIGFTHEVQHISHDKPTPTTPNLTTWLRSSGDDLYIYGNLRENHGHSPQLHAINYKYNHPNLLPANNQILEDALEALSLCHENDIKPLIRGFSN